MKLKNFLTLTAAALIFVSCTTAKAEPENPIDNKVVVAYVTSWTEEIPDAKYMTHINYAFGHVNETFDGVLVNNPERLHKIVALKDSAPSLHVLLSIGGWGSGRFSEMAADSLNRLSFARDCKRVVDEFGLDGIDIDWEYPTSNAAGISASPDDTKNFTKMMRDIRQEIGPDKELTLATVATAQYIDFHGILPYIDFVNTMAYDMANPPQLHSGLYDSENTPDITSDRCIRAHLQAGVPPSMLVLGMPFYGRGREPFHTFAEFSKMDKLPEGYTEKWDSLAMVPYIVNDKNELVLGYEDPRSIAIKCDYILENDLRGGMYWDYACDSENGSLIKTVADKIIGKKAGTRVLVINEGGGQHGPFTKAAMEWLKKEARAKNFAVNEIRRSHAISARYLEDYELIIQLDFPPYTWPEYSQEAFVDYIENGKGGWIGFHHATLLGEFDGYPMWHWFSDFMGGIRFQNYIAELADGTVNVEDAAHPVMKGVEASFVIPDDEWYTFDKNPRENVRVLATVDESTYEPASEIKMGDHPVVWTNEAMKAKNVYFLMGHTPQLIETEAFTKMFSNAIDWCLEK